VTAETAGEHGYRPCVGIVLVNPAGEVFVGQRRDSEVPAWQMPQGGIDAGETPVAAGLRELWEETGVTADLVRIEAETADWLRYELPPELQGRVWKGKYRGQEQKWLLVRFLGRDDQVRIATAHPEFSSWRWLAPQDVLAQIVPFKRAVYGAVLAEFGPLL
jgi:putative (di)nucleoside polyphosphate hydrolase